MSQTNQPELILGSSSPYRRELLERLRIPFSVVSPKIDETPKADETPPETALRLALEKARHIAQSHPNALVIGADQVATVNGEQIGKAGGFDKALAQLQMMRGKTALFHSALCLYDARNDSYQLENIITKTTFRDLPDEFGPWNSVFKRFRRRAKKGVFERIFNALSGEPDFEYAMIDATIIRVHQHGMGAKGGLAIRPSGAHAAD